MLGMLPSLAISMGLIDTRLMWMVIDTIGLILPAKLLDTEDTAVLQQWFRDFNHCAVPLLAVQSGGASVAVPLWRTCRH